MRQVYESSVLFSKRRDPASARPRGVSPRGPRVGRRLGVARPRSADRDNRISKRIFRAPRRPSPRVRDAAWRGHAAFGIGAASAPCGLGVRQPAAPHVPMCPVSLPPRIQRLHPTPLLPAPLPQERPLPALP